jgi:Ni,Fe-hydrogenase I large subunit
MAIAPAPPTQTIDISPVGRVEGDLDVRVDISDGVVVDAWTQAELFRGFEVILRGKDPQAGLVVTPRACGICGASHLTCAAWALDTAWGTTVPRNAILARNLGQIVESLQSIPRHHYGLFMIDVTNANYAKSKFYEEAVRRYAPFTGTNYEVGVTISGRPVEIYALLGGQWPHSSFMVPGGVMCAPTLSDMTRATAILDYFRKNWVESMWLGCTLERFEQVKSYDDFMAWLDEKPEHANSDLGYYWRMGIDIGLDKFGRGIGKYITWGYLPHEDKYQKPTIEGRNAALLMKSGVYDGASDTFKLMDQAFTREDMQHAWYDEIGSSTRSTARPLRAKITRSTSKPSTRGPPPFPTNRTGGSKRAPFRDNSSRVGRTAKRGSGKIRWCTTCIARWAVRAYSYATSRACTRSSNSIARPSATSANSASTTSGTSSPSKRRHGLGRNRGDSRRARPLGPSRRR